MDLLLILIIKIRLPNQTKRFLELIETLDPSTCAFSPKFLFHFNLLFEIIVATVLILPVKLLIKFLLNQLNQQLKRKNCFHSHFNQGWNPISL
jgi:hypothetical protein